MSSVTLHPLLPSGAAALRPLFAPLDYHLAITAVLEGRSPGYIFSDNPVAPHVGLLWAQGRVFLAGEADDPALRAAVRAVFAQQFRADAEQRGQHAFSVAYTAEWAPYIEDVLAEYFPLQGLRHAYERETADLDPPQDTQYALQPVDASVVALSHLSGQAELLAEMQSERPSVTDFLMKSFGIMAVHGQEIIGWCLSEYNTAARCELGVATAAPWRRQGVGKATTMATIRRAAATGLECVGWHCWADNAPSIALARSLAFGLRAEYPVAFAYVDPQQGLAVHGSLALEEGEVGQALAWLEKAAALGPLPGWALVQQARAEGARGRTAVALDLLQQAAGQGYTDFGRYDDDPYLAQVRMTAGWGILRRSTT